MTKEELTKIITSMIPDAELQEQTITKNNDTAYNAYLIKSDSINVSPVFYKDQLETLQEDNIREAITKMLKFNANSILKAPIAIHALNLENNKELLKDCKYETVCDLAIVKRALINFDGASATVLIKQETDGPVEPYVFAYLLDTIKPLMENTSKTMNYKDVLNDENLDSDAMFIISNHEKMYGSGAIGDKEYLKKIYNRLGEFYILPSSVHELIIIKKHINDNPEFAYDLKKMVTDINKTEVRPEEKLSDSVYVFDGEKVSIAA